MNARLGLSSYAYYWACRIASLDGAAPMTAWGLLAQTKSLGLEVLQLCDNLPVQAWDKSELKRLGEEARRLGVILEVGASGMNIDHLRSYLEIVQALGAHLLRIAPWSGSPTRHRLPVERLREMVDQLLPACHEHDITLAIENYFDLSDEELAALIQQIGDEHVGVCLDTANSVGALQMPLETVEILAPHAVSLHLKDFVVTKQPMGYRVSGAPLGQGWLDVPAVLDMVHRAGRQPNTLLELWVDPAETNEATLRKEDEWMRQSVAYAHHHLDIRPVYAQELNENMEDTIKWKS